ncbi:Serine/threonine-protein kinase rio2 [Saxophila tyrrhenica]|uniref:Serine/threonine-protein kinase RIO2 n=1 Tax=Saxophila tyrrhenica TaxID=1690608 RepID=A0AAV9P186_9PEZI|nr:Serine/threonine-protein kinase rio2 [Saxophila tyrrhenica]
MKLDTRAIRYLTNEDWRVLAAVEQGSKNHEVVPTPLITQIAGLRGGSGVHKCISSLAKVGLIAKVKNARYDGYRLTYGGLDYLALHTHRLRSTIFSLGNQIGVGKESDIYITASPTNRQQVLKLHRLGRISFRSVKANRDYLRNRSTGSWMYLSRLAAQKEFAVMKVLRREGFAVPEPIGWSRHTVVMEFIDSFPLRMVESVPEPGKLYAELMDMIVQLARRGLIHGDFNEFNILIQENTVPAAMDGGEEKVQLRPVLIDFPQAISTNHANAQMYFDRDVGCVKRYFERRFKYEADEDGPFFQDAMKGSVIEQRLDVEVEASGFSRKMAKDLERYVERAEDGVDEAEQADAAEEDEGDVEDEDAEEEGGEAVLPQDPQVDDPKLAEEIGGLSLGDDLAVKPLDRGRDFGLMPLEVPSEPDIAAEKVHSKKKASGWAI